MVSHLFFYQLMFLGLLWLCVMLHYAWPNEWSCTCSLRVMPSPAHQVKYPHFTTCVRGLCHGITPLFLPADVPGTPLALCHAALCLAKRVYRRRSEAIQASAATAQALPRPEAVSWPHPHAPVCRLCAGPRARPPATRVPATPPRAHARPPAPGGHVVALLPPYQLRLSGLGRVGQYQCQRTSYHLSSRMCH